MKTLIFFILCLPVFLNAQIISFEFEEWEAISNYERPIGWETTQDTLYNRIVKSEDSSDGGFAMHFLTEVGSAFFMCDAYAWTNVSIENPSPFNLKMSFDVKVIPEAGENRPFFIVRVLAFKDGAKLGSADWFPIDPILNYQNISMDIPYANVDSLEITFGGGGLGTSTDGCSGRSQSWVDNVKVHEGIVSSLNNLETDNVQIAPNPIENLINLRGEYRKYKKYEILNSSGELVKKGNINESSIVFSEHGIFFLRLLGENHMTQLKFVNL